MIKDKIDDKIGFRYLLYEIIEKNPKNHKNEDDENEENASNHDNNYKIVGHLNINDIMTHRGCSRRRKGLYYSKIFNDNSQRMKTITYRYPLEHDTKEFRDKLSLFMYIDQKHEEKDTPKTKTKKVVYTLYENDNVIFTDKNTFFEAEVRYRTLNNIND